ncbi:transmembrane ascorbate-dependent reductase CYB561-like [Diadema antillarum]|uniref:transmembrane ascorbate-dependent reductase CYB561-like n=1 Tax=Diadema antillarum TaxID=105358 RepID=UPI003A851024
MDAPAPSFVDAVSRRLLLLLVIAAEIFGLLALILTSLWAGYYSTPGFQWTSTGMMNLHPFVMTLGMVFVFGNALITYRVLSRLSFQRKVIKALHGALMLAVAVCAGLGIYFAVAHAHSTGYSGFNSFHGMIGLSTVALFGLQFIFAAAIFVCPMSPQWIRKAYMRTHAFFGTLAFTLAAATSFSGMQWSTDFGLLTGPAAVYLSAGFFMVTFVVTVIYILSRDQYQAIRPDPTINQSLINKDVVGDA